MDPDPLRRMLPDPALQYRIYLGHDIQDILFLIAAPGYRERRRDNKFLFMPACTHDMCGHDGAVEFQRQPGDGGAGHGVAAEERHRDAVVHFLIDQHADVPVLPDCLQQQAGAVLALGNGRGLIHIAAVLDDPVQPRVVPLAVDQLQGKVIYRQGLAGELPVGYMTGKKDAALIKLPECIEVFQALHFQNFV